MTIREIVQIDEEKCDGCGLCVPSCEEGAIQIVDGKAKVVSDSYCDGLGACLGHCPRGAISIVQREAAAFDEQMVAAHLATTRHAGDRSDSSSLHGCAGTGGCPSTTSQSFSPSSPTASLPEGASLSSRNSDGSVASQLGNWPVQLHLVSPHTPWLRQAELLLVADCVPFACADFHERILAGRPLVIGCPKLDDCGAYVEKLATILEYAQLRSITVARMEVPCCSGLLRIVEAAQRVSGVHVPVHDMMVTRRGELTEQNTASPLADQARLTSAPAIQLPVV